MGIMVKMVHRSYIGRHQMIKWIVMVLIEERLFYVENIEVKLNCQRD